MGADRIYDGGPGYGEHKILNGKPFMTNIVFARGAGNLFRTRGQSGKTDPFLIGPKR